ncbi:SPOR domain-containing protein [Thiorhodovibrio winogradskyi]
MNAPSAAEDISQPGTDESAAAASAPLNQSDDQDADRDATQTDEQPALEDAATADSEAPRDAADASAPAPAATSASPASTDARASNSLVLNSVRYGIQLGAFAQQESAEKFAREKSTDGQSLYFFDSGPEGRMIAVIQGLYSSNQEVSNNLIGIRRKYPNAWPRRFDPGTELTLFNPGAAQQ